jgi:PAS domain S-box-containing protein
MSLDALLHFISSSPAPDQHDPELAFAEVAPNGSVTSINPFGRLSWGWRVGSVLPQDLIIALDSVNQDDPVELPLTLGGLYLKGLAKREGEGWFVIGYEPEDTGGKRDQFSFRGLMDRLPQPAVSLNVAGLSHYVNEATAKEFGSTPDQLLGRPILSEIIHPEDRWKIAELMELAAKDGSSHASVRFGRQSKIGVLHLVQSFGEEFQAVILPMDEEEDLINGSYVQESIYQSFLEQGPIGVLYLDTDGRVTFENHYFRGLVGEDPDSSWLGLTLYEVGHLTSESASKILASTRHRTAQKLQIDLVDPATRKTHKHIQVHAAGILHPDGSLIGSTLLVEDRTEWVRQQKELDRLERSEKIRSGLRELATTSPQPGTFRDASIQLMGDAVSAQRSSLLGLSVSKDRLVEVAGWSSSETFQAPESIDREELTYFENMPVGQFLHQSDIEGFGICDRFESSTCWLSPVHDNGQFAGFLFFGWRNEAQIPDFCDVSFIHDMVTLFESLYSWIQLGARYRTTVASIDDALFGFSFFKDGSRKYHFATNQFETLTGYSPSRIMDDGEDSLDWALHIVHEDDLSILRTHNLTLLEGHESRVTYRIHHHDGSIRWLREHATPRRDSTGMTAVNGIISDVSEQKAAELVLLQAKREAEASDRSKTAFIATLSHEIRTPLGAVHGFTQLLEKEMEEFEEELSSDLPDQIREFMTAISERSQQLLALVDDLFELSNIEMGKVAIQETAVALPAVVRAAAEKARSGAERKGLELHVSIHENDIRIFGESRRLTQVVDNLLSNAVKFTEEGSIHVGVSTRGDRAVIEVEDTGVGISPDYVDRLFEAFSQEEDWRNRKYQGTGLGLALANRLVDMMHGNIEVESEKGKGSTFRVSFPMVTPRLDAVSARSFERIARFE